jgi:legumain
MKAILFLALVVVAAQAANWAVLIAGSNTYGNYRHQSDICHAYQILHKNGIPDSHIITFMFDDIASSRSNPFPGKIFNKPTAAGVAGVDVYAGVPKDYTGTATTAKNLLAALQGLKDQVPAGHKVLESGPNDNVFVYYSDHGGTGLVAMPTGPYLYATDLIAALKNMHNKKMYNKLVFYLEACESGSMFNKVLPADINVFATTASNPDESSWGWYCSPDDHIDGKTIGSCLGDEYSVRWMEDSDIAPHTETLQQQFQIVQKATVKSHVCQYGDMRFNSESIFNYQGAANNTVRPAAKPAQAAPSSLGVNSRDVQLHFLYTQYAMNPSAETAEALRAEIASRQSLDAAFTNLARAVFGNEYKTVMTLKPKSICEEKCCQPVVNYIQSKGGFTDYSLKYVSNIVTMCEQGSDADYLLQAAKDLF